MKIKEYKETHQKGMLSIENKDLCKLSGKEVDFGLQVSSDGRVWICIDGSAFIRFKPSYKES